MVAPSAESVTALAESAEDHPAGAAVGLAAECQRPAAVDDDLVAARGRHRSSDQRVVRRRQPVAVAGVRYRSLDTDGRAAARSVVPEYARAVVGLDLAEDLVGRTPVGGSAFARPSAVDV
jgi:hypothetical protein